MDWRLRSAAFRWLDRLPGGGRAYRLLQGAFSRRLRRSAASGALLQARAERAVAALARFYKIAPEEILVAHDELDILPGQLKLKRGGSHAGHNGLRDIHEQLASADYWRLRLGIGHPGVKSEVIHWVLKKPMPAHLEAIEDCITRSLQAVPLLLGGDMTRATMLLHTKAVKPEPPGAPG